MALEKIEQEQLEVIENSASSQVSDAIAEKGVVHTNNYIPNEARDEDVVTLKTWMVIVVLSASYGLSFWVVTTLGAIQAQVSTQLGNPGNAAWWTTVYTMCTAISFMVFGGNSDLFGRRWFVISGNILVFAGYIAIGSAKNTESIIGGCTSIGMGAGLCQLSAFGIPELLPNRLRHIGVLIADASTWIAVLFGPIVARYAIRHGESWRWLFYAAAIGTFIVFFLLIWLYHPPKHPRGIPWDQALRELDYLGAVLFTAGAVCVFTGVIYTTIIPSSDPKVIALLCVGFAVIGVFASYERFAPLKQAMCPPDIFAKDKGREFTYPFIAGVIVNMFFYSVNIVYPTCINVLWTTASTPLSTQLEYTLPQNLGLIFGSMLLWFFGIKIGHWKWQFIAVFGAMTLFGSLMALAKPDNMAMIMVFCFICEGAYGWAQTLSITWIQMGVPQTQLGISGALAGVARWTGGALSSSIYLAILSNVQIEQAGKLISKAVAATGGSQATATALISAIPLGAEAIAKIPGTTEAMVAAAGGAFVQSYVVALRTVCLTSIAFGVVGTICCCLSNDIGPKMNDKIEVFLENDVQAGKNRFH
ncbi:MFS general substrate transporter [Lindgomyces ingoldianus]|uniref:MFS general substrate transporter n=1 Tax=Lindgomyces ingoldianus TaxID=673940 RepID=A0ACB6RAC4_9PLEO|nr:MFS general substrate transporter [Lindgomyces ingoldianus]KAF2476268.1 MFS general substrate transporter [Lindgomyces ingoldianus]